MQIPIYLDWNVFNKIEKLAQLDSSEQEVYSKIEEQILSNNIITPYSNAHISDLARGYLKNPDYLEGHLKTIERLTHKLCIVQYCLTISVSYFSFQLSQIASMFT